MIGLAGPVTRSPHHGISTAWFSIATKSLIVAIMCTDAMQPTGDPAKWTAVGIPYMDAKSAIRLVSRIPPDVSGSVWMMSTALFSISGRNPSSRPKRLSPVLRSEEHTSELQSLRHLVCRLLLEKKNTTIITLSPVYTIRDRQYSRLLSIRY